MVNPILAIDGYKLDHRRQYPDGTQYVYSNWTPRSSRVTGVNDVVFVGLQYFLEKYLMEEFQTNFFDKDIADVCIEYERRVNGYLGPNKIGTDHIFDLHQLGYLPLEFKALPEGTSVPLRVPMLTVENTHPEFAWLVNYFETIMSNVLWMPCTSATTAKHLRELLRDYAELTGSPIEFVDFQGHDFSMRGMAGPESAQLSGLGHLVSFVGTDTIPAIELVEQYYGKGLGNDYLIGCSVAATEHSVMCAGGEDDELTTYQRILDLYPSGIVSVVSDTWDLWEVLLGILPKLKDQILTRDGKLVIRPDSGDPVDIICGDNNARPGSPAHKGVVQILWEEFGGNITSTGHRLLDQHIGVIYGDSITYERAQAILYRLDQKGYASANIVLGVGSYSYQYVTRDTFGFAMKATWVQINGEGRSIFKKPVTDDGVKNSAKGRLAVVENLGKLRLIDNAAPYEELESLLRLVWRNGRFVKYDNLQDIRARAR